MRRGVALPSPRSASCNANRLKRLWENNFKPRGQNRAIHRDRSIARRRGSESDAPWAAAADASPRRYRALIGRSSLQLRDRRVRCPRVRVRCVRIRRARSTAVALRRAVRRRRGLPAIRLHESPRRNERRRTRRFLFLAATKAGAAPLSRRHRRSDDRRFRCDAASPRAAGDGGLRVRNSGEWSGMPCSRFIQ